jgi:SPP1 family predicted phage head-tail adaptor
MRRPGQLRHKITIQTYTETQDGLGQPALSPTTFATPWACVESAGDQAGREFEAANQRMADVSYLVEIRYLAGVTPRMRIIYGSETLEIMSVNDPDGRRRRLVMACREAV